VIYLFSGSLHLLLNVSAAIKAVFLFPTAVANVIAPVSYVKQAELVVHPLVFLAVIATTQRIAPRDGSRLALAILLVVAQTVLKNLPLVEEAIDAALQPEIKYIPISIVQVVLVWPVLSKNVLAMPQIQMALIIQPKGPVRIILVVQEANANLPLLQTAVKVQQ
jgi:hypothetical protein